MKGYIHFKIEQVQLIEATFGSTYLKSYKLWLTTIKVKKV